MATIKIIFIFRILYIFHLFFFFFYICLRFSFVALSFFPAFLSCVFLYVSFPLCLLFASIEICQSIKDYYVVSLNLNVPYNIYRYGRGIDYQMNIIKAKGLNEYCNLACCNKQFNNSSVIHGNIVRILQSPFVFSSI